MTWARASGWFIKPLTRVCRRSAQWQITLLDVVLRKRCARGGGEPGKGPISAKPRWRWTGAVTSSRRQGKSPT